MAEEPKTYQPNWGEKSKSKHRHKHHRSRRKLPARGTMDKQTYYGLVVLIIGVVMIVIALAGKWIYNEIKTMPFDNPDEELQVDVLRIDKVEEQKALLASDSLAQAYKVDSIKRKVQIETVPVYRPPRKNSEWYITKKEWQEMMQNYKIRKLEKQQAEKDEQKAK